MDVVRWARKAKHIRHCTAREGVDLQGASLTPSQLTGLHHACGMYDFVNNPDIMFPHSCSAVQAVWR